MNESGARRYSDLEIELLIDELSEAAKEAIEQSAAEAARAAALAGLEREAMALMEVRRWRQEAEMRQQRITELKKAGVKNVVIAGAVCLLGGIALGRANSK